MLDYRGTGFALPKPRFGFCFRTNVNIFTSFIWRAASFMSKFEESLRELVREELEGRKPAPAPDGRQVFWLFLCVANAAMLIWLLPETVFHNQRAENLSKFVVWLGGTVFISSFVWFRDKLLGLTRSNLFNGVQVLALPLLTLLYLSQLSIFTIHPIIEPKDAELIIGGQNVSQEEREDLPLSLNKYEIILQPAGWKPVEDTSVYPQPRKFMLKRSDVFSAWWGGVQPRWSLIYNVYLNPHGEVAEVVVQSVGQDFDSTFVDKPEPPPSDQRLARTIGPPRASARELVYEWHGARDITLPIRLPHGMYEIFSRKKGCEETHRAEVEVLGASLRITELQEPCVQSQ